jgi:hypothetical protein
MTTDAPRHWQKRSKRKNAVTSCPAPLASFGVDENDTDRSESRKMIPPMITNLETLSFFFDTGLTA